MIFTIPEHGVNLVHGMKKEIFTDEQKILYFLQLCACCLRQTRLNYPFQPGFEIEQIKQKLCFSSRALEHYALCHLEICNAFWWCQGWWWWKSWQQCLVQWGSQMFPLVLWIEIWQEDGKGKARISSTPTSQELYNIYYLFYFGLIFPFKAFLILCY